MISRFFFLYLLIMPAGRMQNRMQNRLLTSGSYPDLLNTNIQRWSYIHLFLILSSILLDKCLLLH